MHDYGHFSCIIMGLPGCPETHNPSAGGSTPSGPTRLNLSVPATKPPSQGSQRSLNGSECWVAAPYHLMINMRLTIDKAGRVVVPKPLRDELCLEPGVATSFIFLK